MKDDRYSPFLVSGLSLNDVKYLRAAIRYAIDQNPDDPRTYEWERIYEQITQEAEAYCQSVLSQVKPAKATMA